MTLTAQQNTDSDARLELLAPDAYAGLLTKLLAKGSCYGKTQDVGAVKLLDLVLVTETDRGQDEVRKSITTEKLYLVFDIKFWPTDYARKLAVKDIAQKWARRLIGEADMNEADFKGPGLWTSKNSAFEFDYAPKGNGIYAPNPEGGRLCLKLSEPTLIPTAWGEPFLIPAGGVLAIRERDVSALAAVLHKLSDGKISAKEALYRDSSDAAQIAAFDVYGMMPGFLDENYQPIPARPETQSQLRAFKNGHCKSHNG